MSHRRLKFLSSFGLSASVYRQEMGNRFASWAEITGTERAA